MPVDTTEERLNLAYRDAGWGWLAEAAGFNPYHTESSARAAFDFCWYLLTKEQQQAVKDTVKREKEC